jgi:UPF0271 protein
VSALKALVLDTSSFIQGFNSSDPSTSLFTTYFVKGEVRDEMAQIRLDNWDRTGRITIKNPDEENLNHILAASKKLGENKALSATDHSVIALAYELSKDYDVTVISDDYAVQNLSDELGIKHKGLITRGIKKRFQWVHYCPGCWKYFDGPQEDNECPICGTEVKRKPGKKSSRRRA